MLAYPGNISLENPLGNFPAPGSVSLYVLIGFNPLILRGVSFVCVITLVFSYMILIQDFGFPL